LKNNYRAYPSYYFGSKGLSKEELAKILGLSEKKTKKVLESFYDYATKMV
jgi:chromosome segregation and condensation protein ScpB